MTFPCEKCGACCRAVRCKDLNGNLCKRYEDRPQICRVNDMAKVKGIPLNEYHEQSKKACEELRRIIWTR
jgi:Fe-S-cluster containining protein